MYRFEVEDCVRLAHDIPNHWLARGEVGIVRSVWRYPTIAYEVEFPPTGLHATTRALLLSEQLQEADPARAEAAR